jgi:hypothetical protein
MTILGVAEESDVASADVASGFSRTCKVRLKADATYLLMVCERPAIGRDSGLGDVRLTPNLAGGSHGIQCARD